MIKNVIIGLTILLKYESSGWIDCDHDVLRAGPSVKREDLSVEELKIMEEAEWTYDEESKSWVFHV